MAVKVKVLYSPTCANSLVWLDRIGELVKEINGDVVVEEIDVYEHPEVLKKYWLDIWQQFKDGYIHYFLLVVVNDEVINWYWDLGKVKEAILRRLEREP